MQRGVLGGFNRSSQRLDGEERLCEEEAGEAGGGWPAADAVAWSSAGGAAGGSPAALGGDRPGCRVRIRRWRSACRLSSGPGGSRRGGGMAPFSQAPLSGRYLSFAEREEIAILVARGCGVRHWPAGPGGRRRPGWRSMTRSGSTVLAHAADGMPHRARPGWFWVLLLWQPLDGGAISIARARARCGQWRDGAPGGHRERLLRTRFSRWAMRRRGYLVIFVRNSQALATAGQRGQHGHDHHVKPAMYSGHEQDAGDEQQGRDDRGGRDHLESLPDRLRTRVGLRTAVQDE